METNNLLITINELKIVNNFLKSLKNTPENFFDLLRDLDIGIFYIWAKGVLYELKSPEVIPIINLLKEYNNCYCGSFFSLEELAKYHFSEMLGYEKLQLVEKYLKLDEKAEEIANQYTLIYQSSSVFIAFKRRDNYSHLIE